jgi:hypothetical protein
MSILELNNESHENLAAQWHVFHSSWMKDLAALKKIYTETTDVDLMDILRDAPHITQLKIDIDFSRQMISELEYQMALNSFNYKQYNITPEFHRLLTAEHYMGQGLLRNNSSTE